MNLRTVTSRVEIHNAIAADFAAILQHLQAGNIMDAKVLAARHARINREDATYFSLREDRPFTPSIDEDDAKRSHHRRNEYGDDYARDYISHETRCLRNE